jgi:hypothetical protein
MLVRLWKLTQSFSSLCFGNNIIPFPLLAFMLCKQDKLLHVRMHNVGFIL